LSETAILEVSFCRERKADTVAQPQHPTPLTPSDVERRRQQVEEWPVLAILPPHVWEAEEAFHRSLADLLRNHPGKWVAYQGSTLMEIANSKAEVFHKCQQRGLDVTRLFVRLVAESPEIDYLGPREISS
jgi:hypothetical protein